MRSLFKVTLLSVLLLTSSNAKDLLDLATNGAIGNKAIKALNDNKMKDVKGGYYISTVFKLSNSEVAVAAIPDVLNELGLITNENGSIDLTKSEAHDRGICGPNIVECYLYPDSQTHYQTSRNRLIEYFQAMGSSYDLINYALVLTMKRNVTVGRDGTRYPIYVTGLGAYEYSTKTVHRVNLSMEQMMQNNTIVKELSKEATKPMKEMLEYLNKARP